MASQEWLKLGSVFAFVPLVSSLVELPITPAGTEVVLEAPAQKGWVLYTVRPGDVLGQIAQRFRVDPRAIMWSSGLKSDLLRPGMQLKIPLSGELQAQVRLPPGVKEYRVMNGATLERVAAKFGVSLLDMVSANPGISSLDHLAEGSTLYVTAGQKGLLLEVQKGQTLMDLAEKFGVSVPRLAKANALRSPLDLKPGDMVLIPGVMARTTLDRLVEKRRQELIAKALEEKRLAEERRQKQLAALRRKQEEARRTAQAQSSLRKLDASRTATATRLRQVGYSDDGFRWPVGNFTITTYFGGRGVYQRYHTGLDLAAPYGTPIYAAKSGQVEVAGWSRYGYGNHIIIDNGGGVETLYGHLSRFAVRSGQWVERGQLIGYIGSTGWSTGPHLHLEIRVGGVARNPLAYLP